MRQLITAIIAMAMLVASTTSQANPNTHHHGSRHYGRHTHTEWLAPLVIGSVAGYVLTRATNPPPQVIYYPTPVPPAMPQGYHYEQVLDANCNCYRVVLVPNF